jgi:hypothetical protein
MNTEEIDLEAAVNETADNPFDRYQENPFSVLESPPTPFADAARASARELAERRGFSYLDEEPLDVDGPSAARVGADELARLDAVPVRCGDGSLRVVVSETTDERIAAVREHFSTEVALGVVTPATLDRLLDAARTTGTPPTPADAPERKENLNQNLERVLNLFDEEAGRFQVLRQKLQQLASQMSEREQRLQQVEQELARMTVERQHDQMTIERLRNDLHDRDGRLERAAAKAQELGAIIRGGSPR